MICQKDPEQRLPEGCFGVHVLRLFRVWEKIFHSVRYFDNKSDLVNRVTSMAAVFCGDDSTYDGRG